MDDRLKIEGVAPARESPGVVVNGDGCGLEAEGVQHAMPPRVDDVSRIARLQALLAELAGQIEDDRHQWAAERQEHQQLREICQTLNRDYNEEVQRVEVDRRLGALAIEQYRSLREEYERLLQTSAAAAEEFRTHRAELDYLAHQCEDERRRSEHLDHENRILRAEILSLRAHEELRRIRAEERQLLGLRDAQARLLICGSAISDQPAKFPSPARETDADLRIAWHDALATQLQSLSTRLERQRGEAERLIHPAHRSGLRGPVEVARSTAFFPFGEAQALGEVREGSRAIASSPSPPTLPLKAVGDQTGSAAS